MPIAFWCVLVAGLLPPLTVCYLADKATARSAMWLFGYLDVVAIFLLPVLAK